MLVLESGTRFHLSKYTREKNNTPSNFCLKLRKHIRSKRIEKVEQVGVDRIVDFTIGSGPARHHLILELYSQGNLILTDGDYKVLTLLRSHRDDRQDFAIMANHPYPMDHSRTSNEVTADMLAECVRANLGTPLKSIVSKVVPYGAQIAEHCVLLSKLDPKMQVSADLSPEDAEAIVANINAVGRALSFRESEVPQGYLFLKPSSGGDDDDKPKVYDTFEPFLTKQSESKDYQRYDTFNEAVDEFYSTIECQKQEVVKHQEKKQISSKLDKIKIDQEKRIDSLRNQALSTNKKAQLIEYNLASVDAAINAVNEAIASGFDWKELDQMIKSEQEAGNPVAQLVDSLQLDRNCVTLRLQNNLDDFEEEKGRKVLKVQVDLNMTAHANACSLYQQRKKHEKKESKTVEASQKALKAAEKQANSHMKKLKVTTGFKIARKQFWFEKFDWFVSSENFLVVSGRDAQQNELLVKRYLTKHDIYVHADIHGAASCVIRNRVGGGAIPPATLLEAGTFCVCHSQAWNSKFTTGSWWVFSNQVSKTAPTGEYLQTGSFMIRGKKNFLQPTQLLMGYTVLFKLDEDSVSSHLGERCSKQEDSGENAELADMPPLETVQIEAVAENEDEEEEEEEEEEEGDALDLLDTTAVLNGSEDFEQVGYIAGSGQKSTYTSAREREKMKSEAAKAEAAEKKQKSQAQQKKHVRGKHGKKKKMKKYADQDDEDRALAMMLLGNPGGGKKQAPNDKDQGKREEEEDHQKASQAEDGAKGKGAEDETPEAEPEKQGQSAGAGKPAENRELDTQRESNDGDIDILNSLTGLPREDDIMLFSLPMCAPYSSIMSYKYKVKLQPGNLRKGKAAKAAMEMLLKTHQPPQREYDLLKSIPEQELVAAMVGNSKPSVSFRRGVPKGLARATQKGKGGGKKGGGKKKKK